ncbi:hypothetical protein KM043_012600 [Ampulex compressa]|nr:hypothetical protein KM043_012600 [Ampulex compressa]
MHHILSLGLALSLLHLRGLALSWQDKVTFYDDCRIFNDSRVYGGPVCGSDSVTYANSLYLDCINHHTFRSVATVHPGTCLLAEKYCEMNLRYEPVCGSDNSTYTNLESLLCVRHKYLRDVTLAFRGPCETNDDCFRHGTETYGINPVCCNNGFTYQNAGQVKCLQRYNDALKILHDGGCSVKYVYALYGTSGKVCEIAESRYEWNPVCSSDEVTYPNPFVFLCYHSDVRLSSQGECKTRTQISCSNVDEIGFVSENGRYVNKTFTSDDEVCGSDGRTYASIHHLQCHTRQDKYLFLKHEAACSGPDDNPCGSIPEEDNRLPVCASDGLSYVSPEALWCSSLQRPGKKLTYLHDGPC